MRYLLVLAVLCGAPAFAEVVLGDPNATLTDSVTAQPMGTRFLQQAGSSLLDALMAVFTAAGGFLIIWLRAQAQSSKLAKAMLVVSEYLAGAGKRLMEGLAPEVKAALANDGVIDAVERGKLYAKGVELVMTELPAWVQGILKSSFGAGLITTLHGKVAEVVDANLVALSPPK